MRLDLAMDPNWLPDGDPNKSTADDPAPEVEPRLEVDCIRVYSSKPASPPIRSDDPAPA